MGPAGSFKWLIKAVIAQAFKDLTNNSGDVRGCVKDSAMAWINAPDCESCCLALGLDYQTVRQAAAGLYREYLERETA